MLRRGGSSPLLGIAFGQIAGCATPLAGWSKQLDECERVGVMRMRLPTPCHYSPIAQLAEQGAVNTEVAGSYPARGVGRGVLNP